MDPLRRSGEPSWRRGGGHCSCHGWPAPRRKKSCGRGENTNSAPPARPPTCRAPPGPGHTGTRSARGAPRKGHRDISASHLVTMPPSAKSSKRPRGEVFADSDAAGPSSSSSPMDNGDEVRRAALAACAACMPLAAGDTVNRVTAVHTVVVLFEWLQFVFEISLLFGVTAQKLLRGCVRD